MSDQKIIYMDNAATTQISHEVLCGMLPYLTTSYGNPSAVYSLGYEAKKAIEEARKKVAESINASPDEIFFTSGGTESDNWALRGTCDSLFRHMPCIPHVITSQIEHHAVMHTFEQIAKDGFVNMTFAPVGHYGGVLKNDFIDAIIPNETRLVSIMTANNETGTIQPIKFISEICEEKHIIFHTDAVQAYGHIPIDVKKMKVDLLSVSGHKVHAPKGVGFLYIRKGSIDISNFMYGGAQERKRRAGTENVAGIVGLGIAAERCSVNSSEGWDDVERIRVIRNYMMERILNDIPKSFLNGESKERCLPNILNISFLDIEGESLAMALNLRGICISTGSACTTGDVSPSYVLKAMGRTDEAAHGAIRISLSRYNTMEEADIVCSAIKEEVERLRKF